MTVVVLDTASIHHNIGKVLFYLLSVLLRKEVPAGRYQVEPDRNRPETGQILLATLRHLGEGNHLCRDR